MFSRAPEVYFMIPAWVYLGLLATVATFAAGLKTWSYVNVLSNARAEARLDRIGQRFRLFATQVLGQKRRFDEPMTGVAYAYLVWACVIHAAAFVWDLARATLFEMFAPILPDVSMRYTADTPVVRWILIASAVIGLAGVVVAAFGRYPRRRWQTILMLTLTGLVFASSLISIIMTGRNQSLALGAWWLEMLTLLALISYLPFSRFVHVVAGPISVLTTSFRPGRLPPASAGVTPPGEFTWRELLSGLACADCGRCESVCTAFQATAERSPRALMQTMGASVRADTLERVPIRPEQLWACDTCAACMEVCPSFNEHVPLIVEMRNRLFSDGCSEPGLQIAIGNLLLYGNSLGMPAARRADWTHGLGFAIPDARRQPVEYLWFVGDYASMHPRVMSATRAAARVMHRARVDFGILYQAEQSAGNDVRRAGAEPMFELLTQNNLRALSNAHFAKVVTTDPHTYNVLKNEYPWNGRKPAVVHISELLDTLFESGRLSAAHNVSRIATYQDPCYLGRYNGVYEPPRRVLAAVGAECVEMPGCRASAWCCGAGGGRIWMKELLAGGSPAAVTRVHNAARLPYVDAVVTACPKDLVVFDEAVKTAGLEDRLAVIDLAELVEEAITSDYSAEMPRIAIA